jgi:hypothetical protein
MELELSDDEGFARNRRILHENDLSAARAGRSCRAAGCGAGHIRCRRTAVPWVRQRIEGTLNEADTDACSSQAPPSEKLAQIRDKWIKTVRLVITGGDESQLLNTLGYRSWWLNSLRNIRLSERAAPVLYQSAKELTCYCERYQLSEDDLVERLFTQIKFLNELDRHLHSYDLSFLKAYDLWTHRDVIQCMPPSQVAKFLNNHGLDETISEYISAPWLHNGYLDWVILDAISFRKLVALRQEYLITRYGVIAYFLANGVVWRMWALRLLVWLAKWGLPVVICYLIAEKSAFAAIITTAFWYGSYILWLIVKLWDKIFILITLKKLYYKK